MNMKNLFQAIILKQILPPLLAMLILTCLMAGTVNQLASSWERESLGLSRKLANIVVLNNIRWNLLQIQNVVQQDPEQATQMWRGIKPQIRSFAQNSGNFNDAITLETFVRKDENMYQIDSLLKSDLFYVSLDQVHGSLSKQQQETAFVTQWVTFSILILGLILMGLTSLDLGKLFLDLAKSRDLNITLQEEERRRIAQELHDGVIQELIDLKRAYAPQKVDQMVENIRRICHNLKPQVLEDIGFTAAIEFLCDDLRQGGSASVHLSLDEDELKHLPKDYELTIFRVVQELFNNIKKHSQATAVRLSVVYDVSEKRKLQLVIQDNGCGFDPKSAKKGMGLIGVQERIQRLGGQIKIESEIDKGTQFRISVPIH